MCPFGMALERPGLVRREAVATRDTVRQRLALATLRRVQIRGHRSTSVRPWPALEPQLRENRLSEQSTLRELPANTIPVLGRLVELDSLVTAVDYRGYEFDDFLDSPIVRALSFDNLLLKRIFIQVGERLPWNIRPLLAVRKLPSTKANGFFARGYLHAYQATGEAQWLERRTALLDWLIENTSPGYSGPAWGNAFDFASRGGVIKQGEPTVVWTSHIGEAFLTAHSILGDSRIPRCRRGHRRVRAAGLTAPRGRRWHLHRIHAHWRVARTQLEPPRRSRAPPRVGRSTVTRGNSTSRVERSHGRSST